MFLNRTLTQLNATKTSEIQLQNTKIGFSNIVLTLKNQKQIENEHIVQAKRKRNPKRKITRIYNVIQWQKHFLQRI